MNSAERMEEQLDTLWLALSSKEAPLTAKRLAARLSLTKQTVYSHLRALRAAGVEISETQVREGRTGPLATAYKLAPGELLRRTRRPASAPPSQPDQG